MSKLRSQPAPVHGLLPNKWQHRYWKLAPVSWEHDFYVVTIEHLKQTAQRAGFDLVHVRNLTFITAADSPIGQVCDLRVHAHRPPILRTSGWAKCTPGRLESARSAVSRSDPNTNPTVSGFLNVLLCNIFRIIARPAQSAFSEHIGKYPRAVIATCGNLPTRCAPV